MVDPATTKCVLINAEEKQKEIALCGHSGKLAMAFGLLNSWRCSAVQLRIEAQGKYLQSILEKACKALNNHAAASAGLEAARKELFELAIKVSNDCQGMVPFNNIKLLSLSELAATVENETTSSMPARIGDCSVESCLTSTGSPVSPMGLSSQAAIMKKRPRLLFANGDPLPLDDNMRQVIEWVMPTVG